MNIISLVSHNKHGDIKEYIEKQVLWQSCLPGSGNICASVVKGVVAALLGTTPGEVYKLMMKTSSVVKLVMIKYIFKNQILKQFYMPI